MVECTKAYTRLYKGIEFRIEYEVVATRGNKLYKHIVTILNPNTGDWQRYMLTLPKIDSSNKFMHQSFSSYVENVL